MKICIIIPCYNHASTLASVAREAQVKHFDVIAKMYFIQNVIIQKRQR